jgi:hypothetical protein
VVAVRLAEDDRGRIPFALIGVLLLLGSVAVATVQLDDRRVNQNAALAGDRAEAAAETTLRDAVRDAGARAAADPVLSRSNGSYGQVLDPERPFRSYLELLIAIELRERIDSTPQRVADASAGVALEPIDDPASAQMALDRVNVSSAGRGVVRVTVDDIPIQLRRNGEPVATRHRTLAANVTTPALTLHERTTEFQSRLNGDTLEPGTLNRGLTGTLWGLAWARGYAQYANVPLENVVTNDHVELLTNRAVLDVQRSVFGGADRQGQERLAERATLLVADEALGLGEIGLEAAGLAPNLSRPDVDDVVDSPDPEPRTIGVNGTADRALADVVEASAEPEGSTIARGSDPWRFGYRELVRTAASIDARLLTTRRPGAAERVESGAPAGDGWTRGRSLGTTEREVVSVRESAAPVPATPAGWETHREAQRTVVVAWTERVRYANDENGSVRTVEERYRRPVDVGIALVHRPVRREWIPDAGDPESDGDVYGPLLDEAESSLLEDRGGVRGVARTVASDDVVQAETTIAPDDVDEMATDAYGQLAGVRDDAETITTTAPPTYALTDAAPVEDLAEGVRDRATAYRAVPGTYGSLAQRTRVALRNVYVNRVLRRLDARSGGGDAMRGDISEAVGETSQLPDVGLGDFLEIGLDYTRPDASPIRTREPAPALALTVDADPSYLSTEEVNETRVRPPDDPYHPLGARTTTIGSLPTDRITETITEAIAGILTDEPTEKAPLPVAARTLRSAERVDDGEAREEGMVADRDALRDAVADELDDLEARLASTVAAESGLGERSSERVVGEALSIYGGSGATVIALDDGTATARIADVAARRGDLGEHATDRLRTLLRDDVYEYVAEDGNQVKLSRIESVSEPTRSVIQDSVQRAVDAADERGEALVRQRVLQQTRFTVLPSRGFPVAPAPSWWVVTANVWHVEVQGSYSSFVVRAEQGGPSGGAHVSYVRDGQAVHVDVNGDGTPETLGRSDRIRFYASSTVAVAVPRGGGGVGNNGTGFRSVTDGWENDRDSRGVCGPGSGPNAGPTAGPTTGPQFEFCGSDEGGQ